jgi:hypothetical protein
MKTVFNKFLFAGTILLVVLAGCQKNIPQAVLTPPSPSLLTASSSTLVLDSTNAATTTALTLTWPAVNFGAQVAVTYILQIDSVNDNFAKPVTVNLATGLAMSYSAASLNSLALSLGLVPTVSGVITARVAANVNQSTGTASTVATVYSNAVNLTITPYSTIAKALYPVPANLFLVGNATPGGWANPVPVPTQQFTPIDANTFGIVVQLTGGDSLLFLPVNGDWSHKYAVAGTPNPAGGAFVPDAPHNMAGPVSSGLYKIIVDFVKGTYAITPAVAGDIPTNLYLIGDATAAGWTNPVPVPSYQFTQISSGEFKITIALLNTGSYLFLPVNGDWTNKYGGAAATGGPLLYDGTVPNSNTPPPAASGTYTIDVNFFSNQYTVK